MEIHQIIILLLEADLTRSNDHGYAQACLEMAIKAAKLIPPGFRERALRLDRKLKELKKLVREIEQLRSTDREAASQTYEGLKDAIQNLPNEWF